MSHALKIVVERAVRPLRAPLDTKLRLREELSAHIETIYAEELKQTDSNQLALDRTLERFGAPRELELQLQQSLSWSERFFGELSLRIARQPFEGPCRFGLRCAVLMLAYISLVPIVSTGLNLVLGKSTSAVSAELIWLLGMLEMDAFLVGWLAAATHDRQCVSTRPALMQWRVWCSALISGVVVSLLGLATYAIISVDSVISARTQETWLLIGAGMSVMFVLLIQLFAREWRRREPWESLVLESTI